MHRAARFLTIPATIAVGACNESTDARSAAVNFLFVPYACSTSVPIDLSIDNRVVATDTIKFAVPPYDHVKSRDFVVSPGEHVLGARVVIPVELGGPGFAWPDKHVLLVAGATLSDSLPFYCS